MIPRNVLKVGLLVVRDYGGNMCGESVYRVHSVDKTTVLLRLGLSVIAAYYKMNVHTVVEKFSVYNPMIHQEPDIPF